AASEWSLDPVKGDLEANRYDISLHSIAAIARPLDGAGSPDGNEAALKATAADAALVQWWQRAAATTPPVFAKVAELDRFINTGDAMFFRVIPHRAKLALFRGLTKAVADHVRAKAPDAVEKVWRNFERLDATWWLAGEERQVHYGENLFDPPDFSLDAFRAYAWSHGAPPADLRRR